MALIETGSIDSFGAAISPVLKEEKPYVKVLKDIMSFVSITRKAEAPTELAFGVSESPWGITLKNILLKKGFESFLAKLFNSKYDVYFVSLAWDLSGQPVYDHPGEGASPDSCIIPMKAGDLREFVGAGTLLYPSRPITGGIALRVFIWESDKDVREFGETMQEVSKTVKDSKLNETLNLIAAMTDVTVATLALVKEAALELTDVVGKVMAKKSDNYIDFYEGYYPITYDWKNKEEKYMGDASEITIRRIGV